MEKCHLASVVSVTICVLVSVLEAQTLTTALHTDHAEMSHSTMTTAGQTSEVASPMVASSPAPTVDRACYAFAPIPDYGLRVVPHRDRGNYVYNSSQDVTLTCFVMDTDNPNSQDYVFIHSCRPCNGRWIVSEAGRGKASMVLKGQEVFNASQNRPTRCAFSCWRYNSTCTHAWSQSDLVHFRPERFECMRGHRVALRRMITFGDTPRPDGISCVSDNWTGLQCKWTLRKTTRTSRPSLEPTECSVTFYYTTQANASEDHSVGPITYVIKLDQENSTFLANFAVPSEHYGPFYQYSITFLVNTVYGDVTETYNVTADANTVPSWLPQVTTGGYVYNANDKGPNGLTIYWKALAPEDQNGNQTEYKVVVTGNSEPTEVSFRSRECCGTTVDQVSFVKARACVSAATPVGFSTQPACITILTRSGPQVPSPPDEVIVEYMTSKGKPTYVVRWASTGFATPSPDILTVFWCWGSDHGNTSTVTCQGDIEWTNAQPNTTRYDVNADSMRPLGSSDEKVTWHFGVASSLGILSHGVVWSQCCFSDQGQVSSPVFSVMRTDVSTAKVTWHVHCDTMFSYARPQLLEIYVRQIKLLSEKSSCGEGNSTVVDWPETTGQLTVHDLEPDVSYSVCVRTTSVQGQSVDSDRTILPVLKDKIGKAQYNLPFLSVQGGGTASIQHHVEKDGCTQKKKKLDE